MFRIHFITFILASCLIHFSAGAEQTGLQPGWVEQSRVEVSTTDGFSAWNDPITVSLAVEAQGTPLIAYGSGFFVAQAKNRVTLQHNYPDILPSDAEVTDATMVGQNFPTVTSVETEADIGEIGRWLTSHFAAYGPNVGSVWIDNHIRIGLPVVFLEYRMGEDMPVSTFGDSFAGQTYNLNNLTDSADILNLSFKARAITHDPLNANAQIPAPGVQMRARYQTSLPSYEEVTYYLTPWFETDEKGEVTVDVGGGGAVVETVKDLFVSPSFAGMTVDGLAAGFSTSSVKVEDLNTFKGKLTVRVRDPLGRPITGANVQLQGAASAYEYTDAEGKVEVQINGGGSDTRTVEVTLAPRMLVSSSLTQIVDDVYDSQLHSESPAFYVAKFSITNTAVNYLAGGDSFGDFTLNIYENGVLAAEISGLTAKCAEAMTPADHAASVNTYFYPVLPDESVRKYSHQIVWEDDSGKNMPLSYTGGTRSISEQRVPARERPFRVHFVGIDTAGAFKAPRRGIMQTWVTPSRNSRMNDYFQMMFPGPVEFTYGPDLKTSDPWFTFGPYRVLSYFVDLARLRETMPNRPDLIVGVSAAGVIGADGLSEPRFREVILLDGTGMRESYLLHEYLHTLGLYDNYDFETGERNCGASANGFDPRTMKRIFNEQGALKPAFQTVMYDHAPQPWLTTDDYSKLLDEATVALIDNSVTGSADAGKSSAMQLAEAEPQEVMLIGASILGRQYWSTYTYQVRDAWPIFVDTDTAWQPQEGVSPSAHAVGVRLSNGQTASVLTNTMGLNTDDQLVAAPLFKIPYDPSVNAVTFESHLHGGVTNSILEIPFSPNAPTIRIESPAAGTPLAGSMPLQFVAEDVDAGEQLYAWVKLSGDGGASWSPVGNWFAIEPGLNSFSLPYDDLPAMDSALVRVLVSDGTRSAKVDSGPFPLHGYVDAPQAAASPAWHELTVEAGSRCALPVRITNTGRATLEVRFDGEGLPSWITCLQPDTQSIAWGGSFEFIFNCTAAPSGARNVKLRFNTNDEQNSVLVVPLRLNAVDGPTAPVVASVTTDPPAGLGERVAWERPVRFMVREAAGRRGLTGHVDIHHAETGELLASVDLAAGVVRGAYEAEWAIPAECYGMPLGIEAILSAADGDLRSHGGSNPTGWDARLQLMRRNTAPRFINPIGDKNVSLIFPQTLEIPFDAVDDEGDSISFAIDHTPELDVRLDAEARVLHVAYLTDVPSYLPQIRLAATDMWGATSGVTFTVGIGWQMTNYGYLAYLENFRLESNPMPLEVAGGWSLEKPLRVILESRPEGTADWTALGEFPFTRWNDLKSCWIADAAWSWPEDGSAVHELRVTLVSSDGSYDTQPPVYRFERPRQGGRVTRVEVPAVVNAGSEMVLRVHVENGSSDRWSGLSGHGLRALDGIDPLTGLATAEFMGLQQIERGSTGVVEVRVNAPTTPGVYRTAWGLRAGSTPFGEGAEAYVQVVPCAADASGAATLVDVLLGRVSIQSLAPGSLDLNGDGKFDVADLVTLMN